MIRGYIRPEPRFPASKQRPWLEKDKASPIYEEAIRKRGDGFPQRDGLVKSLRKSHKDVFDVSHFHRIAPDMEGLADAISQIYARGGTIREASTGRSSDDAPSLAAMIFSAYEFYAQRGLTSEQAAKIGKRGAAASPVAKPRTDRMPAGEALTYLKDMTLSVNEAIAAINRDKRYPRKWNFNYAYRLKRKGKLSFPDRPAGPKTKAK